MSWPRRHPDRRARAFALIAVLWVVLAAGLILLGAQRAAQVNLATAHSHLELVRARWLARAGVEQAIAVLADDVGPSDGNADIWYSDESLFRDLELIGGTVSVIAPPDETSDPRTGRFGLIDHAGLLNVNIAGADQLKKLPRVDEETAQAIVDWRDGDSQAGPGGAEAAFYSRLPYPYEVRNGALRTVGELRLIRGVDQTVYLGEDANGNGRLDANEDDLAASAPDDNGDGRLDGGLAHLTTVYSYERNLDAAGENRVNVNTVDKQTLIQRFNFTDELAEAVAGSGGNSGGISGGGNNSPQPGRGGGGESPGQPGRPGPSQRYGKLMDLLNVRAANSNSGSDNEGKVNEISLEWLADHMDELTVSDDERLPARVNVNTAPAEVLLTLPEMRPDLAEKLVRRRSSGQGPFLSVGELLQDKLMTEEQFKACAEALTVRSQVFEIRSFAATRWGIRHNIVAVVDRGADPATVLYWYQSQ